MADEPSLSERLKALRMKEAGDDEEAARRARESKEASKQRLAQHLRAEADDEAGPAGGAAPATPTATANDAAGTGGSAGGAVLGVGATGVEEAEDDDAASFARRLRALQRKGLAEAEAAAPEGPQARAPSRARLLDWFLGREEQAVGHGDVTSIPDFDGKRYEETEFYAVDPPYAFVRILRDRETGERRYEAIEPPLSEAEDEVLRFIEEALVRGLNEDPGDLAPHERDLYLEKAVRQILLDYRIRIDTLSQARLEYYVRRNFLGMGPIHVLMRDPNIEDISCDGAGENLFVFHRDHETVSTNVRFRDDTDLDGFVIRMAQRSGKAISISDPILDAALPDGSRLQATLGREVTENGSTFTIRRFKPDPFTPIDLVRFGSMSVDLLAWFWLIVENGHSLIFSGGTASGKTTALNAICQFIPHSAKLVSIEDTREVNLPHKNWIKSVTRSGSSTEGAGEIGMFELLKAALRQRPEFILVGEVRGIEATVAFQAMATGHTVYSTMHADSARSVVYRLENDPINIPRLVLQALDVIAIQAQVRVDGKRARRVREVVELVGMDPATRELLTNTVFTWDPATDTFRYGGRSYLLERVAEENNWSEARMRAEFQRRQHLIRLMDAGDVLSVERLTDLIRSYGRDPDGVVAQLEALARG